MASAIVSYAPWLAWAFLPPLATRYTLDVLYSSRLLTRPTTPQHAQAHATRTRILLITAYLIYQFTTSLSSSNTEPTAYRLLEVGVESDTETIKRSFRRLAKIHHPDKVGPSGERFFIALRRSHDVLTDSVRRFAYDRFGIAVLDWRGALTVREYMVVGLRESLLFWLVNSAIFAVLSWLNGAGKAASPWSYWHLTLLASLASLELYLITTPTRPRLVRRFLPRHTSGDVVAVLRQTYTSTIMAMRQILPLLVGEAGGSGGGEIKTLVEANKFIEALAGEMDKLGVGAVTMRRQSDLAVVAELEPFRASSSQHDAAVPVSPPSSGALRQRTPLESSYVNHVTQSLIDRSLQASPEVQRAISERRRMQAVAEEEAAAVPPAPAAGASSSSPTATAATAAPSLPPHVAQDAGALPSPPASPRSISSGKSLQPRVSERRSSLGGGSSQSHRRRSGGGGGGGGSRDIRDLAAELRGEQGQQGVLGLDVPSNGATGGGVEQGVEAAAGVDHSREVPPYPQSPKLGGGGYSMVS